MTTLRVTLHDRATSFDIDGTTCAIPVGVGTLAEAFTGDPPHPEELTNAIGLVHDHLEDAGRELPLIEFTHRIEVAGIGVDVVAAVEVGAPTELPFELSREAAEEVFRTLVTEPRLDRRHNPGLPDAMVHDVLAVASALVALMRFLDADTVWLVGQ